MFTLLITLVNVSISSSSERSTALVDVQHNLRYALENLPTAMAQVVQLQRYGNMIMHSFYVMMVN